MDLHYTHMDSNLRLKETQQLDIGKPLVASCKLSKRKHAGMIKRREGTPAQSMGNVSNSKQPMRQTHGGPFTRKAECATKITAARSNEPEENDENELQGFTH